MSKTTTNRTNSVYSVPTQNGDRSFIPDNSISNSKYQDYSISESKLKSDANAMPFLKTGFQNFVDESNKLTATTTTGTPATGRFYSSITNRTSIPDLTQDLKSRMGIERVMTQQIFQIQNEFGSSGEPVWGALNDDKGIIRFVGSGWVNTISNSGRFIASSTVGEYVEITFYGTGLNLLKALGGTTYAMSYLVDGSGSPTTFFNVATSGIIVSRNYSSNQVIQVVSGLSLGVHTVKIAVVTTGINFYGFEILNESSSIKTNPGTAYINGKKVTTAAQDSTSYNTGVTGTKGGRMLVYQDSDGVIRRSFQATDASPLIASSANHQNEEVIRTYNFREFGVGKSDDFSLLTSSASDRAFALDDGTTSLRAESSNVITSGSIEFLNTGSASNYWVFSFVGTGLDIFCVRNGTLGNLQLIVDGTLNTTYSMASTGVNPGIVKIASGLPYGTHTVRVLRDGSNDSLAVSQFIVYGPKKPTLSSGSIELGDYNVMANYSATSTVNSLSVSTGVMAKSMSRELVYVGTWSALALNTNVAGGLYTNTTSAGAYFEYTFFGSGIEVLANSIGSTTTTIQIDGVAYTGSATAIGTSAVWTSGTSTWTVSNDNGGRLQISGLSLGLHKIRVTWATGNFFLHHLHVITPIHSYKSNLYADLQNTLPVGSNAISDNRKITPVKESLPAQKAWAQAVGVTIGPTTNSTSFVPMPDMSCTIKTNGGNLKISYNSNIYHNTTGGEFDFRIYVDGSPVSNPRRLNAPAASYAMNLGDELIVPVSIGIHKIDIYWKTAGGILTANSAWRTLTVEEA